VAYRQENYRNIIQVVLSCSRRIPLLHTLQKNIFINDGRKKNTTFLIEATKSQRKKRISYIHNSETVIMN
jgi:hypothetical protein